MVFYRQMLAQVAIAPVLAAALALTATGSQAQSAGDVVVIGNSPAQWSALEAYWNQLLNLNAPPAPAAVPTSPDQALGPAIDPQLLQQQLASRLRVSNLRLEPIIKLNGSSQLMGVLTNSNPTPVTVSGVNFEILDSNGNLIQTGSATPEPTTLVPGQSVTFKAELLTIPPDGGFRARLAPFPYVIQGGV